MEVMKFESGDIISREYSIIINIGQYPQAKLFEGLADEGNLISYSNSPDSFYIKEDQSLYTFSRIIAMEYEPFDFSGDEAINYLYNFLVKDLRKVTDKNKISRVLI